ncbi:MAG: hypothetical protein H6735_26625 [Alphaproteobacteria bacterium]|nr:hypothetical protein [Alphaproteobacteria bacterium]
MITWWLWTACVPVRETCDAWIDCAASISEEAEIEAEARYGSNGSCFAASGRSGCVRSCEQEMLGVWALHRGESPACDPNELGLGQGLDAETWVQGFVDAYCTSWEVCNDSGCPVFEPDDMPCPDFDPALGEACLAEVPWTCSGAAPEGQSFPIVPITCGRVCG